MVIYDYGRYLRCLHESSKYGICPRGELFPSERANGRQLRFIGGTTQALVKVYLNISVRYSVLLHTLTGSKFKYRFLSLDQIFPQFQLKSTYP